MIGLPLTDGTAVLGAEKSPSAPHRATKPNADDGTSEEITGSLITAPIWRQEKGGPGKALGPPLPMGLTLEGWMGHRPGRSAINPQPIGGTVSRSRGS